MTSTELPWQVWGRKIRPYAFVGWAALAAVLLLWWGWWTQSERAMRTGLLLTSGALAARAAIVLLETGTASVAALLSIAWCVASGGAWLLERSAR